MYTISTSTCRDEETNYRRHCPHTCNVSICYLDGIARTQPIMCTYLPIILGYNVYLPIILGYHVYLPIIILGYNVYLPIVLSYNVF
jgi:hypothetical protein